LPIIIIFFTHSNGKILIFPLKLPILRTLNPIKKNLEIFQKTMSEDYDENFNNEPEVNADDEEHNEENMSQEGDEQLEEEMKAAEENRDPNEEEKMLEEFEDNFEVVEPQSHAQTDKKKRTLQEKITPKFMTKYERARIIGTRALQISKNSPVYVELGRGEKILWSYFTLKLIL